MPEHSFQPIRGLLERFTFCSDLLVNQLKDPSEREIIVHIPQQGLRTISGGGSLPVMIYLAPFTSSGLARAGWKPFGETLPQRHERLVDNGVMKPTILVMPDCFTSLGGNQFVDSKIMGNWSTWLTQGLKLEIINRYKTNNRFALFGKSSGGSGAIYNAIVNPNEWQAIASHSGDIGFEKLYRSNFHTTATQISKMGGLEKFLHHMRQCEKLNSDEFHALMICAMAASYDADYEDSDRIRLPFDLKYCDVNTEAWNNWLKYDPLNLVKKYSKSLKELELLFLDCGDKDQYGIQYGTRSFVKLLTQQKIKHIWEEFSGTHSGIESRLDVSMPLLSNVLHA